jgi:hypothetical protein
MADAADPLDVSGDIHQSPPVDHPGRIRQEQQRAAKQTQGGPLSGLQEGLQNLGADVGRARQAVEGALGHRGKNGQQKTPGLEDLVDETERLAGDVPRQLRRGADFLPPAVLQHLARHPEYMANPLLPLPPLKEPDEQMVSTAARYAYAHSVAATWYQMVHVSQAWRSIANPDAVRHTVHSVENEHTLQGELKRAVLQMDTPATQWIWENLMPELLVAAADATPITAGMDIAGQASDDPQKAAVQAWEQLPWGDYAQIVQQFIEHPGHVDNHLLASVFWKSMTATLAVGSLLPGGGLFSRAGRLGERIAAGEGRRLAEEEAARLGERVAEGGRPPRGPRPGEGAAAGVLRPIGRIAGRGLGTGSRMAFAAPWRKYSEDAVKAARTLSRDPEVPPPDRLGELARTVRGLEPVVVKAARKAGEATGPASAIEREVYADLTAHLNQIRDSIAGEGPSQDRAKELLQRLRLLNVRDDRLEEAYQAFAGLKQADFSSFADFSAARLRRWDDLMEALSKADASKVKMPSALNFLEASDLDTLPTRTLRQLTRLAHEEIASKAVKGFQQAQILDRQKRTMRTLFRGLFGRDKARMAEALGMLDEAGMKRLLPELLPHMSEGQTAFLKAVWNKFMDYDLRRLHEEDIAPRPLHEYLDELEGEARTHGAQLIGATHGVLAFIQGGPHLLEDNAVESLTQALFSRNRAIDGMLGQQFFPRLAALADVGKVDLERAMDAIRDDQAFEQLPAAGRLIVDAWRHVQLLLRDRAMATGFRSDFVGRFDPRVEIREAEDQGAELIPQLRSGGGPISTTSRAHRTEAFTLDPEDPTRIALGEKYRTVRDLNAAMEEARRDHVETLVSQGEDRLTAELAARRRYPLYHQNLAYAMYEFLGKELRALNAHQAVQELLHAYTPEGARLAYRRAERAAPEGYRALRSSGRSYADVLFHPKFADAIDRADKHAIDGNLALAARIGSEAKGLIMVSPMIHAVNVVGRVLPLWLTHPIAAMDELLGRGEDPAIKALDPQERFVYRASRAMQAGVVPHKSGQDFYLNTVKEAGTALGDARMFQVPSGAQAEDASKFIRQRARQMPGLVGRIQPAWLQHLNDMFWGAVYKFQVFAFHVEQRAMTKRFPKMEPARVNMYAAFRANRWGGAIEPENWSQFGYHASRLLLFAPNWLRSYLELQMPRYLRGELAASPELQRYVWEQEIRSIPAMLAGQQITGNALNYLLSGHSIYQNQPQNRNRIEIDPSNPFSPGRIAYDVLHTTDPAITQGVDPNTGLNPKNGAPLTWENPFARQQTQLEQAVGAGDQEEPAAAETFAASHASPLVQALAQAANVDIYKTARNGAMTMEHEDPTGWNPGVLYPALLQFTPIGYSFGAVATQAMHEGPGPHPGQTPPGGEQTWQDQWKAWAHGLPLPTGMQDLVASAPDSALKTVISNALGVQTPYEKAETTKGTRLGDVQDAKLQKVLADHHKVMAEKSQDLLSGKITPAQWREWYQQYTPRYDGQLQSYFQGSPEYVNGQMGLYHQWQSLYADAELPDQSGIDWAKLEQKQADFRAHHTDAEMTAIAAYQAQQEKDYPALRMYREVTENHRAQQRIWARQLGLTDSQMLDMVKSYGQVYGDRHATGVYIAQHPQMAVYLRLNQEWEINSPYGRMYSLYYHTAAMRKWLAAAGETEQQGAQQLEQEFH